MTTRTTVATSGVGIASEMSIIVKCGTTVTTITTTTILQAKSYYHKPFIIVLITSSTHSVNNMHVLINFNG